MCLYAINRERVWNHNGIIMRNPNILPVTKSQNRTGAPQNSQLISPFRFEYNVVSDKLEVFKRLPQRILVIMVFNVDTIWLFRLIQTRYRKKADSAWQIVSYRRQIASFIYCLFALIKISQYFWCGQHQFQF